MNRLYTHGGDRRSQAAKDQADNNVRLVNHGNSRAYLLTRLACDHPDIFDAFTRGEYRSAYAAAKAAGIVKEPIKSG
jgi:hypothetical protein